MVYVTGDMHGEAARLKAPAVRRLKKGDILLVCGDFGFIWDGGPAERRLLEKMGKNRYTIAFLDGRHENFDLLGQYPEEEWNGGRVHRVNDRVVHLCRGEIYTVEGKTFFAFGGGESDDKDFRRPGASWWPEEMPTEEEMRYALDNLAAHGNRADVILTHMPSVKCRARLDRSPADGVGLFLGLVEDTVTCGHWYFGCLHKDKVISAQRRAVFRDIVPVE